MSNLKIQDVLAWLLTVLPMILKMFGLDTDAIMPLMAELFSSIGAIWVIINRFVLTSNETDGIKGFLSSGTIQQGLLALATVWGVRFGIDANEVVNIIQGMVLTATAIFGLINKRNAHTAITGIV